jgi:predicted dehydrogenase
MTKVKIYGATRSIHLIKACLGMGWDVTVVDFEKALKRMEQETYPSCYGKWYPEIHVFERGNEPKGGFDVIFVHTSSDERVLLAIEALEERPKVLQIDKPVCTPYFVGVGELLAKLKKYPGVEVVTGYNHIVSQMVQEAESEIKSLDKQPLSLNAEFCENWSLISGAYSPFLALEDSCLAFWQLGGGAGAENSHATNLWQHFSHLLGLGRIVKVLAHFQMRKTSKVDYDQWFFAQFTTETGFTGKVRQDLLGGPSVKKARIKFSNDEFLECRANYNHLGDVILTNKGPKIVSKKNPNDFYQKTLHQEALQHIKSILDGNKAKDSPISLERGLDTMLVIAAAHKSYQEERPVEIDWSKGYNLEALI